MNGMSSFMYHCSYIIECACSIHENKWSAAYSKRAIISSRGLTLTAFEIEMTHLFHFLQAIRKKWFQFTETIDRFFSKLITGFKWPQWFNTDGFSFNIPGF